MQADIAEQMSRQSDVFVLGRVTYEIFAAYWPSAVRDRGARPRPRAGAGQADADRRRRRRGQAPARLRGRRGLLSPARAGAVERAVADAHRREWAYVLAATVRVTRDLDAAEEAVQDAYVQALRTWARDGVPARPGAWLTTVARRNALNGLRRRRSRTGCRCCWSARTPRCPSPDPDVIPDDRLRLVFTCCHRRCRPRRRSRSRYGSCAA